MNVPIFKVKSAYTVCSITNYGDKAKQYFQLTAADGYDDVLLIRKVVLTTDIKRYGSFRTIKVYKQHILKEYFFSVKMDTLKLALANLLQP